MWLQAVRLKATYDAVRPLLPWLEMILKHVCRDRIRRPYRTDVPISDGCASARVDPAGSARLTQEEVRAALRRLSSRDRDLLRLRYVSDLPPEELAIILGASRALTDQWLSRARRRARRDNDA